MVEKSPNAFRTISEVADVIDVPAHVLRFWESKFAQIKPVKRGGGRRYYRPNDIYLIRGIRDLLYSDGLTIKGAQKVLREKGSKHVMGRGEAAINGTASAQSDHAPAAEIAAAKPAQVAEVSEIDAPIAAHATIQEPAKESDEQQVTGLFFDRSKSKSRARSPMASPELAAQGEADARAGVLSSEAFQEPEQAFENKKKKPAGKKPVQKPHEGEIADLFDHLTSPEDVVKIPGDLLSGDDLDAAPDDAKTSAKDADPVDLAHQDGDEDASDVAGEAAGEDDRQARLHDIYARLQTLRVAMTDDD